MLNKVLERKRGQIRGLQDLQSPPLIAQQLMEEISKEDVDIAQLSRLIEQDPGVLARIIGIANSAFYGCSDKIYSVSDAIIKVLGLNMVKNLALGIVMSNSFRPVKCVEFELDQYWIEAIYTATLARKLAPYVGLKKVNLEDRAYLCGLLHNLGLLVLVHLFPEQMSDVFRQANSINADAKKIHQLQRDIVGFTYTEAGRVLIQKWQLPGEVAAVAEHHGEVDYRGEYWEITSLIGLCINLQSLNFTNSDWGEDNERYISALHLEKDAVKTAFETVAAKKNEITGMAHVLSLD